MLLPILAFDTSAAHCAAALLLPDSLILRLEPMEKGQAERLMPMLEDVLAEGGLAWSDLKALAVGTGPGNFTGIRIAVSAARGLALGLGIPAVTGLAAFVWFTAAYLLAVGGLAASGACCTNSAGTLQVASKTSGWTGLSACTNGWQA